MDEWSMDLRWMRSLISLLTMLHAILLYAFVLRPLIFVYIYTSLLTAMLTSMQSRRGACIYMCVVCLDCEGSYAIGALRVSIVYSAHFWTSFVLLYRTKCT